MHNLKCSDEIMPLNSVIPTLRLLFLSFECMIEFFLLPCYPSSGSNNLYWRHRFIIHPWVPTKWSLPSIVSVIQCDCHVYNLNKSLMATSCWYSLIVLSFVLRAIVDLLLLCIQFPQCRCCMIGMYWRWFFLF